MAITQNIYAQSTVSMTDLRRASITDIVSDSPVAVLNHNKPAAYLLSADYYEFLLDQVETYSKKSVLNNAFQFNVKKQIGSFYKLTEFERGDSIYNIELWPNTGAKLVRAGGTFAQVLNKDKNFLTVKLPSKEHRLIPIDCKACFGSLSNENNRTTNWKKAGKSRWLNKRPTVRGVAKNPVDHPHGGNTSGGCHPVTPWARLTKGRPTRSKKKINKLILKKNSR